METSGGLDDACRAGAVAVEGEAGALRTSKEKLTYGYCLNQHPGNWLDLTLHFSWLKFILNRVLNVGNMGTPSSLLVCGS